MRTPTDERTGFRLAAWAGALLMMVPVGLAGMLAASGTFEEATSESVSASGQLASAGPTVVAVPLLMVVALGGMLARWRRAPGSSPRRSSSCCRPPTWRSPGTSRRCGSPPASG